MKKTLIILALLASSGAALADGNLGLIVKAGSTLSADTGNTDSLMLTVQADDCQHCVTGSYIHLNGSGNDGVIKNDGIGIDYLYKLPSQASGWYYITGGAYIFGNTLNEQTQDRLSYHAGIGMDLNGLVLAVDVFGQPFGGDSEWSPVTLFSAGWHF